MEKITISVHEAADLLSVSTTKMYGLMKETDADFVVTLGGRQLIRKAKLEAWVDRRASGFHSTRRWNESR